MSFSVNPTRQIEAGDTPGFDDDQVSRLMATQLINKGVPSVQIGGVITIATPGNAPGEAPFVPVETKDNTGADNLEIRGVGPNQKVALTLTTGPIQPGGYVQIGASAGELIAWVGTVNNTRYARYIGKEAGIFSRGGDPFPEILSDGVIPDESLLTGEVGWFYLVEGAGV